MLVLAAASTAFTRTVESAQITALPLLVVSTGLCGLFFPLSDLLATVARFLPLAPVVELGQLGLVGLTADGAVVDLAGAWRAAAHPGRAHLSPGTVRNHLSAAAAELGAPNRHAAVAEARRHGWL
jgi:ABC-2 type transport system permease protein